MLWRSRALIVAAAMAAASLFPVPSVPASASSSRSVQASPKWGTVAGWLTWGVAGGGPWSYATVSGIYSENNTSYDLPIKTVSCCGLTKGLFKNCRTAAIRAGIIAPVFRGGNCYVFKNIPIFANYFFVRIVWHSPTGVGDAYACKVKKRWVGIWMWMGTVDPARNKCSPAG